MKRLLAVALLVGLTGPALALECVFSRAIYAEPTLGYELRFYPTINRDAANVSHRFMVVRPDSDRNLRGSISGNMGVSRDTGFAGRGCPNPEVTGIEGTDADWEACQAWKGIVYVLADGGAAPLPWQDQPAPQTLLLTDFGRQIRYSIGLGPADAPWDVFTLKGCSR